MFDEFTTEQRLAFCQAMANIIASDRTVTPEETQELNGLILGCGLSPTDDDVAKVISQELQKPGSLSEILGRVGHPKLRHGLFQMLVEAACVDGNVPPEERAKLHEAAKVFGFEMKAADDLIAWTQDSIRLEQREQEILARLG